jgi:hypothetical protein
MKKIIFIISGVFLSIVVAVVLAVITLFSLVSNKDYDIPYGSFTTISVNELSEEIDRSSFQTSELTEQITFKQGTINSLLYTSILEGFNPNYRAENCISNSCLYVDSIKNSDGEVILGLTSVWVEIYKDSAVLNAVIEYKGLVDIDILLQIGLKAEYVNESVQLRVDQISLGNLTLPDYLVDQIFSLVRNELTTLINNNEDLIIDVDFDTRSISVGNDLQTQFAGVENFRFNDLQLREGKILVDIIYDSSRQVG